MVGTDEVLGIQGFKSPDPTRGRSSN